LRQSFFRAYASDRLFDDLVGSVWQNTRVANEEHLRILRAGVDHWNGWRNSNRAVTPDLSEADLFRANLSNADMSNADLHAADLRAATLSNLRYANLSHADLRDAYLGAADLRDADLSASRLSYSYMSFADLTRADLRAASLNFTDLTFSRLNKARLIEVDLKNTKLFGADLHNANVGWCTFSNVSLYGIDGIDSIKHEGPSTIGTDTLERSAAALSKASADQYAVEVFLALAGVSNDYIDFFRSRVGQAIEFYSCFISYSAKDQEFAERLHADLKGKNLRCWYAPHDLEAGKKIHEQIDEAIRLYDKLLLILSSNSIESEWVKTEIAKARKRETGENRRMLFPIRLVDFETLRDWECFDSDTGKDSAREIREYYVPNFSMWKTDHDAYKRELEKLVIALQAPHKARKRDLKTGKADAEGA